MSRAHCTCSHEGRKLRLPWTVLAALGLTMSAAWAIGADSRATDGNPRISLSFNRATAGEVADRLSRAADTPVWLRPLGENEGTEDLVRIARSRATFQWRSVFFADALRDMQRRWSLSAGIHQDGGTVLSFREPTPAQTNVIAAGNGPGWVAEVESAQWSEERPFAGDTQVSGIRIGVTLRIRTPGAYACRMARLGELRATDGAGREFRSEMSSDLSGGVAEGPDVNRFQVYLNGPVTPRRTLASLEGVIYEYREFEQRRVEAPISRTLPGEVMYSADKGVFLRVLSCAKQPAKPITNGPKGPMMRCRIGERQDNAFVGEVTWGMAAFCPQVVTRSGVSASALYVDDPNAIRKPGGHIFPGITAENGYQVQDYECWYPRLTDDPSKVRLRLVRKGQPVPRFRFRIENIPLSPLSRQGS